AGARPLGIAAAATRNLPFASQPRKRAHEDFGIPAFDQIVGQPVAIGRERGLPLGGGASEQRLGFPRFPALLIVAFDRDRKRVVDVLIGARSSPIDQQHLPIGMPRRRKQAAPNFRQTKRTAAAIGTSPIDVAYPRFFEADVSDPLTVRGPD